MAGAFRISETYSILLNLIRFLCSQGVVLSHLFIFFGFSGRFFTKLASYCVLMFFVLSGFLISYSLRQHRIRSPHYSFSHFFKDRFFRIYPPFIAALAFVFLFDLIGFYITGQYYSFTIYIGNFFINALQLQEFPVATYLNEHYMIEFFRFHYFGTDLPLWTISIEWWLYMFYGFSVFYIIRNSKVRWYHFLILMFLAITPVYYLLVSTRMEKGLTIYWFIGVILTFSRVIYRPKTNFLFILNVLLLATGMLGFVWFGYETSILLFFISLFLFVQTTNDSKFSVHPHLKNISERLAGYSYSLYLIHYTIIYFIMNVFKFDHSVKQFIVVFLIVNIIAYFFAQIFEKPTKKLKSIYENYRSVKD